LNLPRRKKTFAFKALAAIFGLLIFLSLDFGVRQIYLVFRKKPFQDKPGLRIPDEYFHHGIKPNSEGTDIYGAYSAPYFSNSLGLRDKQVRKVSPRKQGARILFIGDSFTESGFLPWEETFVGRVATDLEPRGIEVLNAGVASYCPTLIRIKLRRLIQDQGLEVDRVVVFLDISDIADELFYEEGTDGKAKSVRYGPFRDQAERLAKIDAVCDWMELNVEKKFALLGAVLRNLRLQWRRHGDRDGVTAFDKIPEWKYGWPDYQGEFQLFVEQGLAKAKKEMTELAQFLHRRGIALTVAVYPWPAQVRSGTRPSRAEIEWSGWARQNQADFLSLFPIFVNEQAPEAIIGKYYIRNDGHWNEEGHRLVAEALMKQPDLIGVPAPASR